MMITLPNKFFKTVNYQRSLNNSFTCKLFHHISLMLRQGFPGCLICMQPLFPATLLRKFLPGNFFRKSCWETRFLGQRQLFLDTRYCINHKFSSFAAPHCDPEGHPVCRATAGHRVLLQGQGETSK